MIVAKKKGENPKELAQKIIKLITNEDWLEKVEIAVKGGAITIFLSLGISSIRGRNSSKYFFVSAQVMCIFQLPAITDFLKICCLRKIY